MIVTKKRRMTTKWRFASSGVSSRGREKRRNQPDCNHCDVEFSHSKTSVLKRHLYSKHSPIGKILEHKDVGEPDIEEEEEASFNDT